MKRYLFLACMFICLSGMMNGVLAQNTAGTGSVQKLPDGVMVEDGKLKVKEGYVATLSKDKRSVEVRRQGTKATTGTFSCGCDSDNLSCSTIITGSQILCTGTCSCVLVTTINSIKYLVNMQNGAILRKPVQ